MMGGYEMLGPPPITGDGFLERKLAGLETQMAQLERRSAGIDWVSDQRVFTTGTGYAWSYGPSPLTAQIVVPTEGQMVGIWVQASGGIAAGTGSQFNHLLGIETNFAGTLTAYSDTTLADGLGLVDEWRNWGQNSGWPFGTGWVFRAPQRYMSFTLVHSGAATAATPYWGPRYIYALYF